MPDERSGPNLALAPALPLSWSASTRAAGAHRPMVPCVPTACPHVAGAAPSSTVGWGACLLTHVHARTCVRKCVSAYLRAYLLLPLAGGRHRVLLGHALREHLRAARHGLRLGLALARVHRAAHHRPLLPVGQDHLPVDLQAGRGAPSPGAQDEDEEREVMRGADGATAAA